MPCGIHQTVEQCRFNTMTSDIEKSRLSGGIPKLREKRSSLFYLSGIESAEIEQWDGVFEKRASVAIYSI
jgi:hypothetical protein